MMKVFSLNASASGDSDTSKERVHGLPFNAGLDIENDEAIGIYKSNVIRAKNKLRLIIDTPVNWPSYLLPISTLLIGLSFKLFDFQIEVVEEQSVSIGLATLMLGIVLFSVAVTKQVTSIGSNKALAKDVMDFLPTIDE